MQLVVCLVAKKKINSGECKTYKITLRVSYCTDFLPENKPRYCMGIGYAEDLVVCSAMGVDMYDCVFPTRTARFGRALTRNGPMNLKSGDFKFDFKPIDESCECPTCKKGFSRSYIR